MNAAELRTVQARVRAVAERIQPLLAPHPGLAQRNAYAHIWLGFREVFGPEWRTRTNQASAMAFLDWMSVNPNGEYDEYQGPREEVTPEERGELW